MKFYIYLLVCFSSTLSFGQCVNLYVKKHFSGDPICRLSPGSKLEICLDYNTVSGGACDFYILKVRDTYNGMSIDLALDNVSWAPKYAELMINYKTQNFGFVIGNNSGAYSFLNEADMEKIREEENVERERQEKQRRDEENRKVDADKNEYLKIDNLVNEKKFKEAYLLVNKLYSPSNYPKTTLIENALLEIDKNLNNTINEYAKNGDFIKAFESFDLLNFKNRFTFNLNDWSNIQEDLLIAEYKKRKDNSLSFLARKYLMEKYKDSSEELTNEEMNQIITENKSALSKLKTGVYDLKITNTGNLLIDNKDVTKEYRFTKKNKIFHDEFDIYINGYTKFISSDSLKEFKNSESTGNLIMIEWKLNPKHEKSAVYYIKNKELKFYSDKSGGFKDLNYIGGNGEKLTYDSGISKKSIRYSVIENQVKYVNGIIVNENPGLYTWIDKELIIKKHIANKITYASLLGGLTWCVIRFREYVSANSLTEL